MPKIFVLLIAICGLSGCSLNSPGEFQSTYCKVEKRITWSQQDTDQTIGEVKSHNAVYHSICG